MKPDHAPSAWHRIGARNVRFSVLLYDSHGNKSSLKHLVPENFWRRHRLLDHHQLFSSRVHSSQLHMLEEGQMYGPRRSKSWFDKGRVVKQV
jgi:hypothetical protein